MKITSIKCFLGFIATTVFLGTFLPQQVCSESIVPSIFCVNYPLNSRCDNSISSPQQGLTQAVRQRILITLKTSGPDDESIILDVIEEVSGTVTLTAYHTTSFRENTFLGNVLGNLPTPIPIDFSTRGVTEHETQYIAFVPDSCGGGMLLLEDHLQNLSNCVLLSSETLTLPQTIDIRSGYLILGYIESTLFRSVSFRITDHLATVESDVDVDLDSLCQNYPANSRCRYWPISQVESASSLPSR